MKLSTLSYCLLSFCLSANLCYAAPEGGVVTDGPLTSLDKLETIAAVKNAPSPRRNIAIQQWQTRMRLIPRTRQDRHRRGEFSEPDVVEHHQPNTTNHKPLRRRGKLSW